MRIMCISVNI